MMAFTKKQEDFICDNCKTKVQGNGYTNHCTSCLWSKHVDIEPGDRESSCHGLMPVSNIQTQGDKFILTHTCKKCGFSRRNFTTPNDNFDELIRLSQKLTERD
jgi:RNase P subunit RPR2